MNKIAFHVPNFPGKEKLVMKASRLALKVEKRSPEILIGAGIVTGVTATVMACRATLKVEGIIDEYHKNLQNIQMVTSPENRDKFSEYSDEDARRDKFINMVQTSVKIGKIYMPAIAFGVMSISCFLGSYHIMNQRQLAITAAYTALQECLNGYRKRVQEEIGEDKEKDLFYGVKERLVEETITNKKGEEKIVKKKVNELGEMYSPYARFFDETNPYFKKDNGMNRMFLTYQQSHANDMLRIRGYLFLNEVYDLLGMEPSREGQLVGWIYGGGDSYVDFGIFDPTHLGARRFVNGLERSILLDFNVDGVIYDLI